MPLRAMEDAELSAVSAANLARLHEQNALEEKRALDLENPRHLEEIPDAKN
jgi:hypothetical protein